MRPQTLLGVLLICLFTMSTWIGCSKAEFSTDNMACSGSSCGGVVALGEYDETVTTSSNPIDILFVSDNSGSMSKDQRSLGSKFPAFFSLISGYDYHVAITTTDVSGSGLNGRDGSLVDLGGAKFLSQATANAQTLFQNGIQRPETATCDQYLSTHNCAAVSCADYYNYCPSDDSRAIYAANLALSHNEAGFLRAGAPLHIVILSNADERVLGGTSTRPLEVSDQPSTLKQNATTMLGGTKTLQVHTLTIQPGDASCYNQEYVSSLIFGQYAPVYAQASTMTGGFRGSICASDYTYQLSQIANQATTGLQNSIVLKCKTSDANLTYTLSPNSGIPGHVDAAGTKLVFTSNLSPSTQVHLHYKCL